MSKTFEPRLVAVPGGDSMAAVCSAQEFSRWMAGAKPGDVIVYAEACWLPKDVAAPVLPLIRASYGDGDILTVQRRLAPGRFRYFAVRKARVLVPASVFVARRAAQGGAR